MSTAPVIRERTDLRSHGEDDQSPRASIGAVHAAAIPASLSCLPAKRALFAVDSYFRDAWEDACDRIGPGLDDFLRVHGLLLVKPDAVAGRRLDATLRWLAERDVAIVAAERCRLTRRTIRALWQYQWNLATRDRRDLADLLMPSVESLVLLLRPRAGQPRGDVPFTLILNEMKGPADPEARAPRHLRHSLGNENYLLNFVHTTDEPADMVREIGVLFEPAARRRIYEAARDGRDAAEDARRQVDELHRQVAPQDLSLAGALERLVARARARPPSRERDELLATVERARSGAERDWRGLRALADRAHVPLERWDQIALGTHLMNAKEEGREPVLAGVVAADWLAADRQYS
ncbi:MAG TPA: nucleoside-diphosphate kinase [Thermoleophilaceae bacterium]|jgi:nucleoside diphosphate kinase